MFFGNGKHLEFLAAFQHGGETLTALDFVLIPIFQHRIDGGGNSGIDSKQIAGILNVKSPYFIS